MSRIVVGAAVAAGALLLCGSAGAQQPERARRPIVRGAYLLQGGTLIDGRGGPPQPNASVLIYNGLVQAVGQAERMLIPEGTTVVQTAGKYILPGFVDTHAFARDSLTVRALLANGITAVATPTSTRVGDKDFRELSGSRNVPGPRVFVAGAVIDGPGSRLPDARVAGSEAEIREIVRALDDEDADFVQLHRRLPPDLLTAAVDEAHERKLPVMGDLAATGWIEAARAGIDLLRPIVAGTPGLLPVEAREAYQADVAAGRAHPAVRWLELVEPAGREVDAALGALLGLDVMVEPSLVSLEALLFCADPAYHELVAAYLRSRDEDEGRGEEPAATADPERWRPRCPSAAWPEDMPARAAAAWPKALALTALLHESGVRLVAGSDAPYTPIPPGLGFHRELELLVEAGVSPLNVLSIASRNGAVALGRLHQMGTVEAGKRADIVLLRSDPLADIRATRDIEWVMLEGNVYTPGRREGE